MLKLKRDWRGQTAVEYIMILGVVSILVLGIGKRYRDFMVGNGVCPNNSVVCKLIGAYDGQGLLDSRNRFRFFTVR